MSCSCDCTHLRTIFTGQFYLKVISCHTEILSTKEFAVMRRLSLAVALILCAALPALAQVQGGSITGAVKDQQGGVMPGASVTAQAVDATLTFTTNADGQFRFLNVAPGAYKVSVGLSGFTAVARDVIVSVGKNADMTVLLKIAAIAETVTVTAAAPIVAATPTAESPDVPTAPRKCNTPSRT